MSSSDGGTSGGGAPGPGGVTASNANSVAAKITQVKTTSLDGVGTTGGAISMNSSLNSTLGGQTIMTAGGAIKLSTGGINSTPIALSGAQSTTSASIRAIGASGQSTQVRVVMPTGIMPQSMIKQLESATATGRTQITAIPANPTRSVSNTSITVTRPVTQATYIPRAGVSATQMTGVGVTAGQRLVTPLRATSSAGLTPSVGGLTTAGNFVRCPTVCRSTISQPSTVISAAAATSTAWINTNTSGQVQLIRTIPHNPRQRILATTQGLSTTGAGNSTSSGVNVSNTGGSVSGSVITTSASPAQVAQAQSTANSTIQSTSSTQATGHPQQQQAYVATLSTVLPPRQHQATLVYSSNVGSGPSTQAISQPQQFNSTIAASQRFAVATPLTTNVASSSTSTGIGAAQRQIRPIPLGKPFSAAKLNTTSISIRAPSIPQLTSTMVSSSVSSGPPSITAASTVLAASSRGSISSSVSGTNALTPSNLPTTRIIQLQQPTSGNAQQIIGSTGRLTGNVMLQPIIVNTTTGGKIGIRQPVTTMTAKVQPSLTITQLGTIGKLPVATCGGTANTQQNVTASIQAITSSASASQSIGVSTGASVSSSSASCSTTQLVNVSQGNQLLSAGSIVTSGSGGANVLPLAIAARGGPAGNILTGTITPIKNSSITVGKMMAAPNGTTIDVSNSNAGFAGTTQSGTNVFIHQRSGSNSVSTLGSTGVSVTTPGTTNVVTSSTANAFIAAGSTIYYESMPANSVQVSTGVLSLNTTTITQSTISQAQMVSSAGSLAISSLPFGSHPGGCTTTFTVVPSSAGGRAIGQLQLPAASSAQIQTVPVRLSSAQSNMPNVGNELSATAQLVQAGSGQQLILPTPQAGGAQQSTQHMVIPMQTSVKLTSGVPGNNTPSGNNFTANSLKTTSSVVTNLLRKRDAEGSPIRAAKNLGPTLLSMSSNSNSNNNVIHSNIVVSAASPAGSSNNSSSYSINSNNITVCANPSVTTEDLTKKDRTTSATVVIDSTRCSRADSPASSDGSTTVSANSSPGVEQQMHDSNLVISRIPDRSNDVNNTHFNPINELYPNHQATNLPHNIPNTHLSARLQTAVEQHHHHLHEQQQQVNVDHTQRINGGTFTYECTSHKKARRSTNDSQHSTQSHSSLSLPPPMGNTIGNNLVRVGGSLNTDNYMKNNGGMLLTAAVIAAQNSVNEQINTTGSNLAAAAPVNGQRINSINTAPVIGNKENAKPVEFVLRRPRNCSLLNTYKPTNKLANNHFQRHTDVKPREERRPTVIDLANQVNVNGKINGWKIYHLRSQMEDMVESETSFYDKLDIMLKQLEKDGTKPETEPVNELLKGNMQRSKIIVDGINEAQSNIMKVFDHKTHVSAIINRCASKRNYKKREKS